MNKTKGLIAEFKEFISRGNVIDLAVGVIIGSAFTAIVNSLVEDIIMPIVGLITGGINFTYLKFVFRPASEGVEESAIYYGNFIQNVVNFLIVALVVFLVVKTVNNFYNKQEEEAEAPEEPSEDILLLREIRDSLKDKKD